MKICPDCFAENAKELKFCTACGSSLQADLERLLESLGLDIHWPLFEKNDLKTIQDLRVLDDRNFHELGIPYGDKIRIRKALEAMTQQESLPPVIEGSPQDRLKSRARQGDLAAMHGLGELYSAGGESLDADPVEAAAWFRKAAEKGFADSQYELGEALYFGKGIEENERESAKWLRMAVRQGHSEAKESYNTRLEEGRFAYLLDSAEQGNADSQYHLGCLFYHGEQGSPVDKAQAASWFRKSAAQGLAAAQYLLGKMHLRGDGIRHDEVEARRLIKTAADKGHQEALELLKALEVQAPPSGETIPTPLKDPEKKGGVSPGVLLLGVLLLLLASSPLIYRFLPSETQCRFAGFFLPKEYQQPSPTPLPAGYGAAASSTAGIVSIGSPTPIPVSQPAPFVSTVPTSTPVPLAPAPEPPPSVNKPPSLGSTFVNSLGLRFVPIPGTVTYFSIYDTRVSDYQRFVNETGRFWKPAGFPQQANHPAVRINYYDATAFCQWLTEKDHASGALPQGCEYRLPTDLEWSAAAGIGVELEGPPAWRSGGIPACYAWGSAWPPPPGCGNYDPKMKTDRFSYTSPVGAFARNQFGLYDMNGNAYQWILEDFDESGQGCLRGGSWPDEQEESINISNRFPSSKDTQGQCFGMRCVIAPVNTVSDIRTTRLPN